MGIVNRIVNLLILVLALVAGFYSFKLFNKREAIVKGCDSMAASIADTAKALDQNSGTSLASTLDAKKIDHTKLDGLDKALPLLKKGAADVVKERDSLADGIKDIAGKLEIAVGDEDLKALKAVASSENKRDDIKAKVSKVQDRNQGIINEVVATARKVGLNIDEASLKDTENFRYPLNKLNGKIDGIKKRDDAYVRFIDQIASTLGASKPNLSDEDYTRGLSNTVAFVNNYKSNYENTKRELASERNRARELKNQLDRREEEIAKLAGNLKSAEGKIDELKKIINPDGSASDVALTPVGGIEALKMLKGRIVDVNSKWNFVVIDVGSKAKVVQKYGAKDRTIDAPLPSDKCMTVARDLASSSPEFVGKIKITKVYDDCAIANILPSPSKGEIKVGDAVFFSDEDLSVAKDKKDKDE